MADYSTGVNVEYNIQRDNGNDRPYCKFLPWTPSTAEFTYGPCRAIIVPQDGTVDMVDLWGTPVEDFPVYAGLNELCVKAITAYSGTGDVWLLY